MTKQSPPMDWEAAMKATEANASVAADMAERVAGRMAETLDHLRRHGSQLTRLETMMKEVATREAAPPPLTHRSLPPKPAREFPLLPVITVAFLLGAVFGAFFGNW